MKLERVFDYGDQVALYGLSAVVIVAGLTKLSNPSLWMGFEPAWLQSLVPLTATQFVYATGIIEAAAGTLLGMKWRTRFVAAAISLWLLGITVTVASMSLWTIALRDFGLAVLAYYVAAREG